MLSRHVWLPDSEPRELFVISHGLAEHAGRYAELAGWCVARGGAVYAVDHRGHGRSNGARSYIESFGAVVEDLVGSLQAVRAAAPGRALTLIGHSFGGAVALRAALDHPGSLERLVLSAPAVGVDPDLPRTRQLLGRILSTIAPRTGLLRLDASAVSSDPGVVADYERDPLNYRGPIPARTLVKLLAAMRHIAADAPELRTPTLVVHGTADRLVPLAFNAPVYARLGAPDLTVLEYPGYFHELLNEPGRARVHADLGAWLDARA